MIRIHEFRAASRGNNNVEYKQKQKELSVCKFIGEWTYLS